MTNTSVTPALVLALLGTVIIRHEADAIALRKPADEVNENSIYKVVCLLVIGAYSLGFPHHLGSAE